MKQKKLSQFNPLFGRVKKGFFIFLNVFLLVPVGTLFATSLYHLHIQKPTAPNLNNSPYLTIHKGQPISEVADQLEKRKQVASASGFLKWMKRSGLDRNIKFGHFRLSDQFSLWHFMNRLCHTSLSNLRLLEGFTLQEMAHSFSKQGLHTNTFLKLAKDKAFIQSLGLDASSLEGYLFPDTYRITYGEDEAKTLKMMVNRFQNVISDLQLEQSLIHKRYGFYKGLIIASLIEKESRYLPERPRIASVFWNRLEKNWRLDSDVTVHYAIGDWKKKLTRKDLKTDSPFNTRKYKGLPPTPICNPGRSAIEAAFFPKQTNDMFFVASGSKRGHSIFSKTVKEHNKTVKKLRKLKRL